MNTTLNVSTNVSNAVWLTAVCLCLATSHMLGFVQGKKLSIPVVAGVALDVLVALSGAIVWLLLQGAAYTWMRVLAVLCLGIAAGGGASLMVSIGGFKGASDRLKADDDARKKVEDQENIEAVTRLFQTLKTKTEADHMSPSQVEETLMKTELSFLLGYLENAHPTGYEALKSVFASKVATDYTTAPRTQTVEPNSVVSHVDHLIGALSKMPPATPPPPDAPPPPATES